MTFSRRRFGQLALAAGVTAPSAVEALEPLSDFESLLLEGRYLPYYLAYKAEFENGNGMAADMFSQFAAFLGDEASAIGAMESPPAPNQPRPDLTRAESRDALEAIVDAARDKRMVILNEGHNISGHRAFATRVMRALRDEGFDWLAAETFGHHLDPGYPSIADYRPGQPFTSRHGYYTNDPVYAELVREAARLDYRFAAYEVRPDQSEGIPPDQQGARRELAQAENLIANVLEPHPDARVLVIAGYGHAWEIEGRIAMFATQLRRLTGLDPLTIEQSENWPALRPENDPAHVAEVLRRFRPERPISVSIDGAMVSAPTNLGRMDLSVFHPRYPMVNGRPGWLAADPMRRQTTVDLATFDDVTLLQAMRVEEGAGGVPADQFLLTPGQAEATLLLHPGEYFLRLETPDGIRPAWRTLSVSA